jgi:hypothetical protein
MIIVQFSLVWYYAMRQMLSTADGAWNLQFIFNLRAWRKRHLHKIGCARKKNKYCSEIIPMWKHKTWEEDRDSNMLINTYPKTPMIRRIKPQDKDWTSRPQFPAHVTPIRNKDLQKSSASIAYTNKLVSSQNWEVGK